MSLVFETVLFEIVFGPSPKKGLRFQPSESFEMILNLAKLFLFLLAFLSPSEKEDTAKEATNRHVYAASVTENCGNIAAKNRNFYLLGRASARFQNRIIFRTPAQFLTADLDLF